MPGINVIIEDLATHPHCAHGPTLLFSKKHKTGERCYYACSACRDRKVCPFFLWKDELRCDVNEKNNKTISDSEELVKPRILYKKLNKIKAVSSSQRMYCHTCSVLDLADKLPTHKDHDVVNNISNYQLEHPTELLKPMKDSKKEAQYFFSKNCVKSVVEILLNLGYKNAICLGTPKIFEYLRSDPSKKMNTILLDIDSRYHNFFSPLEFCWYNLFNNHFFKEKTKDVFLNFLSSTNPTNTILLMDPPFGGRVEAIASTLEKIDNQYKKTLNIQKDLPIFWIYPYFMECHILNVMKNFVMLDYKVNYENHTSFQSGDKGRKHGSPVRIFTNVDPSAIILPAEDGYKYCNICNKWVSSENKHCGRCNGCTSKDGKTYVHCNACEKCVKPSWSHCKKCNRCALKDHTCKELTFTKVCFHCNQAGHKKTDCPKMSNQAQKKRKLQ